MSRKTNQLRKRLRILELQLARRQRLHLLREKQWRKEMDRRDPSKGSIVLFWRQDIKIPRRWGIQVEVDLVPYRPQVVERVFERLRTELVKILKMKDEG